MRNFLRINLTIILAFSFILIGNAQITGSGKMITKNYDLSDVYRVEAGMYADITIDMAAEAGVTISAEENIIDFIGLTMEDGSLTIDQKKWIEATQRIRITIGAPELREVFMGTHDDLSVINITGNIFKVEAEIGKVILSGQVEDLRIKSESGIVDASQLISRVASVKIKSDGEVVLNTSESIKCDVDDDGRIQNLNTDAQLSNCSRINKAIDKDLSKIKYIDLEIKNNSWGRKHFVVVGPKPDGRSFSYGFPMMPGATKKERWTTGTKIYRENRVGIRTLLVTLTADDENTTVRLF